MNCNHMSGIIWGSEAWSCSHKLWLWWDGGRLECRRRRSRHGCGCSIEFSPSSRGWRGDQDAGVWGEKTGRASKGNRGVPQVGTQTQVGTKRLPDLWTNKCRCRWKVHRYLRPLGHDPHPQVLQILLEASRRWPMQMGDSTRRHMSIPLRWKWRPEVPTEGMIEAWWTSKANPAKANRKHWAGQVENWNQCRWSSAQRLRSRRWWSSWWKLVFIHEISTSWPRNKKTGHNMTEGWELGGHPELPTQGHERSLSRNGELFVLPRWGRMRSELWKGNPVAPGIGGDPRAAWTWSRDGNVAHGQQLWCGSYHRPAREDGPMPWQTKEEAERARGANAAKDGRRAEEDHHAWTCCCTICSRCSWRSCIQASSAPKRTSPIIIIIIIKSRSWMAREAKEVEVPYQVPAFPFARLQRQFDCIWHGDNHGRWHHRKHQLLRGIWARHFLSPGYGKLLGTRCVSPLNSKSKHWINLL